MLHFDGWLLSKHCIVHRCLCVLSFCLSSNRFRCDRRYMYIYSFISFRLRSFSLSCFFFLFVLHLSLSARLPRFAAMCLLSAVFACTTRSYGPRKIRYLTKSNCELFCLHQNRRLFYMIFHFFFSMRLVRFVVSHDTTCSRWEHGVCACVQYVGWKPSPKLMVAHALCASELSTSSFAIVFFFFLLVSFFFFT